MFNSLLIYFFILILYKMTTQNGRARNGWKERTSGRDLEVRNTVDYIERLEKGYSSQARNGFTQQAITTAVTSVSNRPIKK